MVFIRKRSQQPQNTAILSLPFKTFAMTRLPFMFGTRVTNDLVFHMLSLFTSVVVYCVTEYVQSIGQHKLNLYNIYARSFVFGVFYVSSILLFDASKHIAVFLVLLFLYFSQRLIGGKIILVRPTIYPCIIIVLL